MAPSKHSISSHVLTRMIIVSTAFVVLIAFLEINNQYSEYSDDISKLRKQNMTRKVDMLHNVVDNALDYIEFQRSQTKEKLNKSIKSRVNEANTVAMAIYERNHDKRSDNEITKQIIETLSMMKYNGNRGYYFIIDLNGNTLLNANNRKLDGVNAITLKDVKGKPFIKEMIETVKKNGAGFVDYFWKYPSESTGDYAKTSYVKEFKPLRFLIGTGEYERDFELDIQQAVIKRLSNLRFENNQNYLFASGTDGSPLFTNGKITLGGPNLFKNPNPKLVEIFRQQLLASEKPQGGLFEYKWRKLNTNTPTPKLSYVTQYKKWNWIIGAGIYLDDFNTIIAQQNEVLKARIRLNVLLLISSIVLLILVSFLISKRVARKLDFSFKRFITFFNHAADDSAKIETNELFFSEFRQLAESANAMIDARKKAELARDASTSALSVSEEKFKNIVENLHECAWETNKIGELSYISPKVFDALGFRPEDILNTPIIDLLDKQSRRQFLKLHITTSRDKTPFSNIILELKTKNGSKVLIETNGTPILNSKGDITGFRGASRDITAQKRNEEFIRQSEKMDTLGQLAGGIAHDFNNQLTGISGYAQLLERHIDGNENIEKYVKMIKKSSARAADLTAQLLAFARKGKHLSSVIDVNDLISEVISILDHTIDKRIIIQSELNATSGITKGDPTQLQNVLLNIALNARDAIQGKGEIHFSTQQVTLDQKDCEQSPSINPGEYIRIEMSDNGSGMDEETTKHIFEPFFTTKEQSGTGMGLAAVYGTVKNHNGAILFETKLGSGTKFIIFLPAVKAQIKNTKTSESSENSLANSTILIIDDEEVISDMTAEMLQSFDCNTHTYTNGMDAVDFYKQSWKKVDLIILDMIMPGWDGEETYMRLREINPALKVILCSGYNADGKAQKIIDAGCNAFMHKPFQQDELISTITQVIAGD